MYPLSASGSLLVAGVLPLAGYTGGEARRVPPLRRSCCVGAMRGSLRSCSIAGGETRGGIRIGSSVHGLLRRPPRLPLRARDC